MTNTAATIAPASVFANFGAASSCAKLDDVMAANTATVSALER